MVISKSAIILLWSAARKRKMADGGVATQETPNVEWAEDKALNAADQRILSVKLGSPSASDPAQRHASLSVDELLEERDEMWREHGRSLCGFMEREHGRLLHVLHQEIEQLQRKCGDVTLELAKALSLADTVSGEEIKSDAHPDAGPTKSTIDRLQKELSSARKELAILHQMNKDKGEQIAAMERQYNEYENRARDDLDRKKKMIKDITTELNQKSAVITQVMTQLHQLRLREAVEKQKRQLGEQQARRRQMLLASTRKTPAHAWLHGDDDGDHSSIQLLEAHAPMRRSRTGLFTSPASVRSSILPPIFFSPLSLPSSTVNNIEKPEAVAKPFRSSFRRTGSGRSTE